MHDKGCKCDAQGHINSEKYFEGTGFKPSSPKKKKSLFYYKPEQREEEKKEKMTSLLTVER